MVTFRDVSRQYCLSELTAQESDFRSEHFFDAQNGKVKSSFGYLEEGQVTLTSLTGEVNAAAGELVYIPEGARYSSSWRGSPTIRFLSLHFLFGQPYELPLDRRYGIQSLSGSVAQEAGALMRQIFRLLESDSTAAQTQALSRFYQLLALCLPEMTSSDAPPLHPAVEAAVAYLETHFGEDVRIPQLARYCLVSESRLFHLFQEQLHTTPVAFLSQLRVRQAAEFLKDRRYSMREIAGLCGFNTDSSFRKTFRRVTGMNPSDLRKLTRDTPPERSTGGGCL